MATRGRGGAVGGGGAWPNYEDFKPNSEWQQDAQNHNLVISIPGFVKEQLKVSTEGHNVIRVRGERLVGGSKWSRFLEDFDVPENSNMNEVRAKFHEGTLTITVPKKTIDKPHEFVPEEKKGAEPHKDEKHGKVDDRSKEASSSKAKHAGVEKAKHELEKTMGEEEKSGRSKDRLGKGETSGGKIKLKMDDEAIESSGAQHGAFMEPLTGLAAKDKGKDGKEKEASDAKHEALTKAVVLTKAAKGLAVAAKEKGKEAKKRVIGSSGAEHGAFTKAVKGLTELNDERQLMVNMGVAVLIIVSLSAYVTYKFVARDDKK